jgi:hypothetical protein
VKRFFTVLVIVGLLSTSVISVATAQGTNEIEVVSGNTSAGENQPGWLFNRDVNTSTPFEFNTDQASIGQGSLYVMPIGSNPSDKFIGEFFINEPIANINSVSYDFLIGSGGTSEDAVHFYMNVYANFGVSDDLKFYDCRYAVLPSVNSEGTVTFDPGQAYLVATRGDAPFTCPAVPADMDTLSEGSTVRVFSLNVGDTSASDIGLDGYLDNVVVTLASGTTTYDFEPAPTTDEMIDELQLAVDELVTNPRAEAALQQTLDRMQLYVDRGNTFFAYMTMLQFVIQVDRYENTRMISPDAATELIALMKDLRSSLS